MFKKLLFLGALTVGITGMAQTNLSFETWADEFQLGYEDPSEWATLNVMSLFGAPISTEKSTDAQHGTYSCQMTTVTADLGDGPEAVAGAAVLSADGFAPGIPYTSRPDSIIFWYKYVPQGADQAIAYVNLTNNGSTVCEISTLLEAQATWTRFGLDLNYANANTPDTLSIGFASSAGAPVDGSVLKVDAVEIKMGPGTVGLNDVISSSEILMYPNPARNELNVRLEKEATIEIYNVLGAKIETLKSNGTDKTIISVSDFSNGVYILKTSTGISQRFVVKH